MWRRIFFMLAIVVIGFVNISQGVLAADTTNGGIVPCGTGNNPPCTLCHLVIGVKGVIDWGMRVMTFFAIAIIVAMAIVYVVSAGNSGMMTKAKNGITATLIGFAIMLGSWVMINFFMLTLANNGVGHATNWYTFTCNTASKTQQANQTSPPAATTGGTGGPLAVGCSNYANDFSAVAQSTGVDKCLLQAIAMAESSCNPNVTASDGLSCGLMQVRTNESGQTCADQKTTPRLQIEKAAAKLRSNKSALNQYSGTFNIGANYTQSGTKVQITNQGQSYDTGNDDLIASYNAGTGNNLSKDPFHVSADCPGGIPAWQCPINPGDFGSATQPYTAHVQNYQSQCR